MKKSAVAISVFLLAAVAATAQSSLVSQIAGDKAATEKLYFSLKFGLTCGTLRGVDSGLERLGGFNVGLTATIKLTDRLSLVPEVTPFSRKGGTNLPFVTTGDPELDPYFAEPAKAALVLDYVDIPVQLKFRTGRINLGAGPFVGFLTGASERFRAELDTGREVLYEDDVTAAYRNLNYGLVFEASVVVTKPRRGEGLVFHIRYQAGLADILRDPAAASAVRTSNVQVYLSFPFIH